jgi:hypothetical protein
VFSSYGTIKDQDLISKLRKDGYMECLILADITTAIIKTQDASVGTVDLAEQARPKSQHQLVWSGGQAADCCRAPLQDSVPEGAGWFVCEGSC